MKKNKIEVFDGHGEFVSEKRALKLEKKLLNLQTVLSQQELNIKPFQVLNTMIKDLSVHGKR